MGALPSRGGLLATGGPAEGLLGADQRRERFRETAGREPQRGAGTTELFLQRTLFPHFLLATVDRCHLRIASVIIRRGS